jgi:hypothetical protein
MSRCTRCGQTFEDPEAICHYHPGDLLDYDTGKLKSHLYGRGEIPGDFWSCCNQLDSQPGCTQGPHTTDSEQLRRGIVGWSAPSSPAELEAEYQRRVDDHY